MSKSRLFIFFSSFLILGIFINNFFGDFKISFKVLFFLIVLFLLFFIYTKKYVIVLFLSTIGFLIGILISQLNINNIYNKMEILEPYYGQKTKIILEINSLKSITEDYKVYLGKLQSGLNYGDIKKENILSEIYLKTNYDLEKGQVIETTAKIYPYKNTPSFKYKYFMLSKNIYFKVYPYNYETLNKNNIFFLEEKILSLRKSFLNTIKEVYTENEAIFLGGILFGAREEMPKELKTNFNNSGLTHLVAVSGFNITILIIFFSLFLKPFPAFIKIISISILVFLFVLLVGANTPVIRAALMGVIGFIAVSLGRNTNILALVLFVALIMLLFSPLSINYDISFHLSFLAVLGIVFVQPYLDKKLNFITNTLEIKDSIVLTLSAVSFCLPVMIFGFGQVSIPVILTNVMVSWTIPLAMLFGFISIIVYSFSNIFGIIIGYFAWILLRWDIFIVNFFGTKKWSTVACDFGEYAGYLEFISFLIIGFLIMYFKNNSKEN